MKKLLLVILLVWGFATLVFAKSDEFSIIPIAKIPQGLHLNVSEMRPTWTQSAPAILILTVGYANNLFPPNSVYTNIWSSYDLLYRKGTQAYLAAVVVNAENTSQHVAIQVRVVGTKIINANLNKTLAGGTIYLVFAKRPLSPNPGLYQLTYTLLQNGLQVDTQYTRFLVVPD